jgi:hypothetical protein
MKLSHLFIATLVAGLVASTGANAVIVTEPNVTLTNGSSSSNTQTITGSDFYNYSENGTLAPETQVIFTYVATNVQNVLLHEEAAGVGANGAPPLLFNPSQPSSQSSPQISGALPVLLTAYFTPTVPGVGTLTGQITLQNLTNSVKDFSAIFVSFLTMAAGGGRVLVSAQASSVPLPPAVLLFASGLIAMAGFGAYKKGYIRV